MMKLKRISAAIVFAVLLLGIMTVAFASGITPYADSVFMSATPNLRNDKSVSFTADTYGTKDSISVTGCTLELYENGKWRRICALTPPAYVAKNTFSYAASMNYSTSIGSGTYRISATFDADGHAITRYSNERIF